MLQGKHITFSYSDSAKGKIDVLKDVSFEIREHDFIGLIGTSGSGKTTLIKHLNGLLKAESGEIFFNGENIYSKKYPISKLRKEVGLVFQYPEQQLFGRTILKDVMYGPLNLGMSEEEAEKSAVESLELVGISKEYYHLSPMELSGGQKRCVAIAGVLAMQPEILVLDEPAAGLDPETKNEIFELLCRIRKERNNAIVLVSHHMEDVAQFANRVWVMHEGKIAMDGTPEEVYGRVEELEEMHIGIPQITHLTYSLIQEGLPLPRPAINVADAEEMLVRIFKGEKIRDITIGRYYDSESVIHRMDPRTKLMGVLVYIISLFLVKNVWWYLGCLIVMLVLYRLARVPVGYLLKGLRGILVLLCFTFLFRMLYTPGDAVASVWIFTITKQGIWKAVQMTARIALMITGASLLSYTSTPKELADGLEKAFSGLGKIGVPVHEMAVIVMIAFRFIPIMLEELNVLMDAQAARGARFEEGNVVEKCKGVMTLLFPLFLMTVRRSSDLAMAMEARGYTGSTETSRMYPLTYKKEDRAGYIVILIYLAVFIIGRISFLFF